VQEMGYRIGAAVIFSLMALALFNDFTRLWWFRDKEQ
jgi:regulator of sigma E protease